ncbi:hypothetical protein OQA88_4892 [Cercophora sp. LCS_1]
MIDFCTGTGCIPLQLLASLQPHVPNLAIHGVDISPKAVSLARRNLRHNVLHRLLSPPSRPNQIITFHQADIFSPSILSDLGLTDTKKPDLLISNPPYISTRSFARDTARSVRNYEPKLALVPERTKDEVDELNSNEADIFYAQLLVLSRMLRPKRVLFEVADLEQAKRVIRMAYRDSWAKGWYSRAEIWRDYPRGGCEEVDIDGGVVRIRGEGNARVIYLECRDLVT